MATRLYQRDGSVLRQVSLGGGATAEELEGLEARITQAQAAAAVADSKAVAAQAAADGRLPLNGGIMTGPLAITKYDMNLDAKPAQDIFNRISFTDNAGRNTGNAGVIQYSDGTMAAGMEAMALVNGASKTSAIRACVDPAGAIYASGPAPRENAYANDVDTLYASINRHPLKAAANIEINVGGANASDTADLFKGRGLSPDKPFATFDAALLWALQTYSSEFELIFNINANLTMRKYIEVHNHIVTLTSANGSTLSITWPCGLIARYAGCVIYDNIHIIGDKQTGGLFATDGGLAIARNSVKITGNSDIFSALVASRGSRIITLGELEVEGTFSSVASATYHSAIILLNEITGSATGRRYASVNGSSILVGGRGPNAIPGTAAGTCDASSIYA